MQLHALVVDAHNIHPDVDIDSDDKVNENVAQRINAAAAQGSEDYANVLSVQDNSGLRVAALAWMVVADGEGAGSAFRTGSTQDRVMNDRGGLYPMTAHACGCMHRVHAAFCSQ